MAKTVKAQVKLPHVKKKPILRNICEQKSDNRSYNRSDKKHPNTIQIFEL